VKRFLKRHWKLIALAAVGVFLWDFFSYHRTGIDSPAAERFRNAHFIGNAMLMYSADHASKLPMKLSDLVPTYISPTNLNWFFSPPKIEVNTSLNWEEWRSQIDTNGAFVYLGTNCAQENVVLHERSNLWPPESQTAAPGVTTLTTNLTARRLPRMDLQQKLARCSGRR
jgi:hypothetical protein